MKILTSPCASVFFKAVLSWVLLAMVLADNTHTATVNEIAVVNVMFSGSPSGTGKLTGSHFPIHSQLYHNRNQMS